MEQELLQIRTSREPETKQAVETMDSLSADQQNSGIDDFNVMLISVQPNTDIIGIKYLHAYLRKNNISSRILILPYYRKEMNSAIEKFFSGHKPTLVGIGILSEEFTTAEKLIQFLKSKYDFTTFMGGHQATIDPEKCLKYVDYVLKGESEDSLLEICQKMSGGESFLSTPSLVYKKDNNIVKNPLRRPEENLDKYPFIEFLPEETYIFHEDSIRKMDDFLFRKYSRYSGRFYSLTTTRGCNFKCSFCIHSFTDKMYAEEKMNVPKIRTRSVDNVMEELRYMKSNYPDTVYVNIQDDNFFAHDIAWLKEFSEKYKRDIALPIVLRAIPIWFTEEKGRVLKECGLTWVLSGMQTGSQRVQKDIYQRPISNEQFLKTTDIIKKLNFCAYYDIILDNPLETEEDVLQTIDVALKIKKPYQLQLLSLTFFPGTVIYDIAKERGIEVEDPFAKNFYGLKNTYLNKIVRLIPLLPNPFVRFLVKARNKKAAKMALPLIYYPAIFTVEPLIWLRLVFKSFNGSIDKTYRMVKSFASLGIKQMIFKMPASYHAHLFSIVKNRLVKLD